MEEEKEKNMDYKNTHLSSLNFSISYPHVCINYRLGTSFYKYKVWNYSFPCQPWEVGNYRLSAQKNIHNIHPDYKSFFFFSQIRQKQQYKHNNTNIPTSICSWPSNPLKRGALFNDKAEINRSTQLSDC